MYISGEEWSSGGLDGPNIIPLASTSNPARALPVTGLGQRWSLTSPVEATQPSFV
ncbi:MAG: hypothetical protein P8L45_11080 [Longimicrobiales bacterium]|nr:hypothetical protein [Longimicrobiales bacterium]